MARRIHHMETQIQTHNTRTRGANPGQTAEETKICSLPFLPMPFSVFLSSVSHALHCDIAEKGMGIASAEKQALFPRCCSVYIPFGGIGQLQFLEWGCNWGTNPCTATPNGGWISAMIIPVVQSDAATLRLASPIVSFFHSSDCKMCSATVCALGFGPVRVAQITIEKRESTGGRNGQSGIKPI